MGRFQATARPVTPLPEAEFDNSTVISANPHGPSFSLRRRYLPVAPASRWWMLGKQYLPPAGDARNTDAKWSSGGCVKNDTRPIAPVFGQSDCLPSPVVL